MNYEEWLKEYFKVRHISTNRNRRNYLDGMDHLLMDEIADLNFDFTELRESQRAVYEQFIRKAVKQMKEHGFIK